MDPYRKVENAMEGEFADESVLRLHNCYMEIRANEIGREKNNPLLKVKDMPAEELRQAAHEAQINLLLVAGKETSDLEALGLTAESVALGHAMVSQNVRLEVNRQRVIAEAARGSLMVSSSIDRDAHLGTVSLDETDPAGYEKRLEAATAYYADMPESGLIAATRAAQVLAGRTLSNSTRDREDRVIANALVFQAQRANPSALAENGSAILSRAADSYSENFGLLSKESPLRLLTEVTGSVLDARLREKTAERVDAAPVR